MAIKFWSPSVNVMAYHQIIAKPMYINMLPIGHWSTLLEIKIKTQISILYFFNRSTIDTLIIMA